MLSFRCSLVTSDRYARYILEKKKKEEKRKEKKNGERKIYTKRTLKITCVSWATLASYVLITRERVSLLIAGGTNRRMCILSSEVIVLGRQEPLLAILRDPRLSRRVSCPPRSSIVGGIVRFHVGQKLVVPLSPLNILQK